MQRVLLVLINTILCTGLQIDTHGYVTYQTSTEPTSDVNGDADIRSGSAGSEDNTDDDLCDLCDFPPPSYPPASPFVCLHPLCDSPPPSSPPTHPPPASPIVCLHTICDRPPPSSPLSPGSPPLTSPPIDSGSYIVESKFVVAGSVDDISESDISDIKDKFASYLGVDKSSITVNIEPGSVLVTVSIATQTVVVAQSVTDDLESVFTNTTTLGVFIGPVVNVMEIVEQPTLTVVDYTLSLNLQTGWNLISINVMDTDLTLNTVFAPANYLDMIKNQTTLSTFYSSMGWFGSFDTISPTSGYYYKASSDFNVDIVGKSASSVPLELDSGWNLISYMLPTTELISKVFPPNLFANADLLKDDQSFTTLYSANGQQVWLGSLNELTPGKGYYFKAKNKTKILMNIIGDSVVITPPSPPLSSPPLSSPPSSSSPPLVVSADTAPSRTTTHATSEKENESNMPGGIVVLLVFVLLLVIILLCVVGRMRYNEKMGRRHRTDPLPITSETNQIQLGRLRAITNAANEQLRRR